MPKRTKHHVWFDQLSAWVEIRRSEVERLQKSAFALGYRHEAREIKTGMVLHEFKPKNTP